MLRRRPVAGSKGAFSTHVSWAIRAELTALVRDQGRPIRIPGYLQVAARKVHRARLALAQELGRRPTDEELAGQLEIEPAELARVLAVPPRELPSLDEPLGDDQQASRGDFIAARGETIEPDVDDYLERLFRAAGVTEAGAYAVRGTLAGLTAAAIAESRGDGVSRQAVSDALSKARRRIRAYLARSGEQAIALEYLRDYAGWSGSTAAPPGAGDR